MDYQGRIVATVGDRGKKTGNRVTNISTMSERQAGSTLKPIAVYALAEEMNLIHYSSIVRDAPTQVSTDTSGRRTMAWGPPTAAMFWWITHCAAR